MTSSDVTTLLVTEHVFLLLLLTSMSLPVWSAAVPTRSSSSSSLPLPTAPTASDPVVKTRLGKIRGQRTYVPSLGREVDVYLGIPFAKPPRGRLRFRHPQPIDPWSPDVLNATELPASCFQKPDTAFGDFFGSTVWNSPTPVSEDCLYLNVFVPRNSAGGGRRPTRHRGKKGSGGLTAVMIWIYGGGFYSGTSTLGLYDGKVLAALGDVIVVSIGYRVGSLGFLNLGHADAPGNAGLFDQLMALDWVQQNVEAFGGDADNVTLFGESAGSVSVSLHLLSPLSHGKFQRAILQSGTANMPWATTSQAESKRRSLEYAFDYLHCPRSSNMSAVAACLRSLPASLLVHEQWVSRGMLQFPFIPVVDGVFLTEKPDELLRRAAFKRCPILLGSNRNEASFFIIYELTDQLGLDRKSMTRDEYLVGLDLLFQYYPQYRPHHRLDDAAMEAVKFQYTHWLDPNDTDKNLYALDMAASDSQFVCPLNQFAQRYAQSGLDVYSYYFTQRYESNPWPDWMGVLHGDEIFFLFGEPFRYRANYTDEERALSRQMILYWTNFAKTGNPNQMPNARGKSRGQEWPLHSPAGKEYYELNAKFLDGRSDTAKAVGRGPRTNECAFWREYLPDLITFADTDSGQKARDVAASPSPLTDPVKENLTCAIQPPQNSGPRGNSAGSLHHQRQQHEQVLRHCVTVVLFVVLQYVACWPWAWHRHGAFR